MKKLTEFFENPVIEARLRFVFRAAVLLSMLVILFLAATGESRAQSVFGGGDRLVAVNGSRDAFTGNYFLPGIPECGYASSPEKEGESKEGPVKIKLYPDPVSDYLLVLTPLLPFNTMVRIVTMDGKILVREVLFAGTTSTVLDLKNFPSGPYALLIENNIGKERVRFEKN